MKNNFFRCLNLRALSKKAKVWGQGLSYIYKLGVIKNDTTFKIILNRTSNVTETFIDKSTGHLLFSNNFEVSYRTTPDNLLLHFGLENVKIKDLENGWKHYIFSNLKKDDTYFVATFYFENDILSFLSFIIDDKPILTGSWGNWSKENELQKKEYFDNWLTKQLGEKREFVWGTVGAFFDNKGGSSSIVLRYVI
jgi:hypothetical protein